MTRYGKYYDCNTHPAILCICLIQEVIILNVLVQNLPSITFCWKKSTAHIPCSSNSFNVKSFFDNGIKQKLSKHWSSVHHLFSIYLHFYHTMCIVLILIKQVIATKVVPVNTIWTVEIYLHSLLTSALEWGERSALWPGWSILAHPDLWLSKHEHWSGQFG